MKINPRLLLFIMKSSKITIFFFYDWFIKSYEYKGLKSETMVDEPRLF